MAKHTKKPIKKPVAPPVVVAPPAEAPEWMKYFPYILTAVFFILSFIGILHHEMWRDEYQAWMVASDAHSVGELFKNLKYEGNPVLWHAFLYVITSFTDNPFSMQVFHILISTSFIFLIGRYAPFSILQKVLLSFGYYTFFEYNLISRSYGLGLLLVVIFCILYQNRQKNILWMAVVLFLLANDTIFGVILAVSFAGIILYENLFRDKKSKAPQIPVIRLGLFLLISFVGVLLGYLQIKPEPDNSFFTQYVTHFDDVRLKWAFSRFIHAYFAIPNFSNLHFWNTNMFVPDEKKFGIGITPLLFLAWMIAFLRYRIVFILYSVGTLILLVFYYYTGFIWSRYSGHLFLLLIACCWLVYFQKEKPFKNVLLNWISLMGNKIRVPFFLLILCVHLIGGVVAYYMDIKYPFSTSQKAAEYLRNNHLTDNEILGSIDYVISPLASELHKKILYPERKEHGTFIIYDQKRTSIWSFSEIQSLVSEMLAKDPKPLILVKSLQITKTYNDTGEVEPWTDGMLTDDISLKLLTTIEPGIVEDEQYYIYKVEKVK